jgi:hypothetical protein
VTVVNAWYQGRRLTVKRFGNFNDVARPALTPKKTAQHGDMRSACAASDNAHDHGKARAAIGILGGIAMRAIILGVALWMSVAGPTAAVAPDECEQQRAVFPKDWNDVSRQQRLYVCHSHYSGSFEITLGEADKRGRQLMSLVPLVKYPEKLTEGSQDRSKDVLRIWLDSEQVRRLRAGKYFGTVVREKESCWIRGSLSSGGDEDDTIFFLDNADPASDSSDKGSFYNKAPRFSAFRGDAYTCEPVK